MSDKLGRKKASIVFQTNYNVVGENHETGPHRYRYDDAVCIAGDLRGAAVADD